MSVTSSASASSRPGSAGLATRFGLPLGGTALDLAKIMAALLMVMDHYNAIFLEWGDSEKFSFLMAHSTTLFLMGRAVFPLFCYATAAAVLRSGGQNPARYALPLLVFGVISTPITSLAWPENFANVLFTLALGGIIASYIDKIPVWQKHGLFLLALASVPLANPLEYGLQGVMLPAAILLVLKGDRAGWLWLPLMALTTNVSSMTDQLDTLLTMKTAIAGTLFGGVGLLGAAGVLYAAQAMEKGEKRLLSRYALHVFYPAHILLLKITHLLLGGAL